MSAMMVLFLLLAFFGAAFIGWTLRQYSEEGLEDDAPAERDGATQ